MNTDNETIGYVRTGEYRPPRAGEWFGGEDGYVYLARNDYPDKEPRHIMRPIPRGSVVLPPALAQEFADYYPEARRCLIASPVSDVLDAIRTRLAAQAPPKPPRCPAPGCGRVCDDDPHHRIIGVEDHFAVGCRCGFRGPWRDTEAKAREAVKQMGGGE